MSDGPIDGRLLTITGTSPEPAEMITRSIQAGPPRRISRDEREPVDSPRPSCGLFCRHASLRTWDAARRSVRDRSGHHAVPTCRRGDLSALGHVVSRPKMMWLGAVGLHCSGLPPASFGPDEKFRRLLDGEQADADQSSNRGLERWWSWNGPGRISAIFPFTSDDGPGRSVSPPRGCARALRARASAIAATLVLCGGWVQVSPLLAEIDAAAHSTPAQSPRPVMDSWTNTLGSEARSASVATSRINPPAGRRRPASTLVGACASSRSSAQARPEATVSGLRAYGRPPAEPPPSCSRHRTHRLSTSSPHRYPSPADPGTASPHHTDAAALSTAPRPPSIDPPDPVAPAASPVRRPAWRSHAPRSIRGVATPHLPASTHTVLLGRSPTRHPTHRLNARGPIGSHFDGHESVSRTPTDF